MVENSELIPGTRYRITDYVTRVDQEDCSSAEHPFDIIVTAVSENTLDENASAAIHDGDEYFLAHDFDILDYAPYMTYERVNVEAWQLKYCVFNDDKRFQFADMENGRGVIYYMKDEWNNEAPYDFKNVLFKRYLITSVNDSEDHQLVGTYGLPSETVACEGSDWIWCYTFHG